MYVHTCMHVLKTLQSCGLTPLWKSTHVHIHVHCTCMYVHTCTLAYKNVTVFQEYFVAENFSIIKIFISDIFVVGCAGILINAHLARDQWLSKSRSPVVFDGCCWRDSSMRERSEQLLYKHNFVFVISYWCSSLKVSGERKFPEMRY